MIFICLTFVKIYLMKRFCGITAIFACSLFTTVSAQEIVKMDTLSGTPLSISMDSRINSAIEALEDNCTRVAAVTAERPRNTSGSASAGTTGGKVLVANRELTTAEICRKSPRLAGYKIQLTVVKSNDEANEVKAYFRRRFPNLKVETDASLRPNYKVLAGSYFTKQSAAGDLAKIRQYFNSAVPVQYRIFCVEAK